MLYVGKARDLRARLRSYFQSARQRPSVEAALDEVARIEWRITGSELAAALEEIRLIRELRPPANSRTPMPERYVYLHRRGERIVLSACAFALRAAPRPRRGAARGAGVEGLHRRGVRCACSPARRSTGSAGASSSCSRSATISTHPRLRRDLASLERTHVRLLELERLRRLDLCVLAPALEPGKLDAYIVGGRPRLPRAERAGGAPGRPASAIEADSLDQLAVVASFLDSPPPELKIGFGGSTAAA